MSTFRPGCPGVCADRESARTSGDPLPAACYRELSLEFSSETHVWNLLSDDGEQTGQPAGRIIFLLSALMREQSEICVPARGLLEKIDPDGIEGFSPNSVSRQIRKSVAALKRSGILVTFRKSNGERLICLRRVDRVDNSPTRNIVPIDPAAVDQPSGGGAGAGETESSLSGGQASRPAIRHAQFRGAAPYPAPEGEKEDQCRE